MASMLRGSVVTAGRAIAAPRYEVTGSGPDHQREFTAVVIADGHPRGTGVAPSKKRAEQIAARIAVRELGGA